MKTPRFRLFVLLTSVLFLCLGFAGCGDDDDDDSASGKTLCETFCEILGECELGGLLDLSGYDECLSYCDDQVGAQLGQCIVQATSCDEAQECLETDSDDDDDDDNDDDNDDAAPPDTFSCESQGLTVRDFVDAPSDDSLYATAADFTVSTTKGEWSFKEKWTGCETYLFIQDTPRQNLGWPTPLWDRDVDTFLERLPANVQVFFAVNSHDESIITEKLAALKVLVDDYLKDLPQDDQDRWWHRLHYVTEPAKDMEGWLGEIMTTPAWGAAVDRFQQIRYIGSYADYARYDGTQGWFAPNLAMAANEPVYYNFEALREEAMEASGATVIPLYTGAPFSGTQTVDITLPDAITMADFDTMEFDLYLGCDGNGEFGTCPAWDYLVYLWLCDAEEPETCDTEIGRWITTYHREGRWVHDVSGILPLLADGGERRFAFHTAQTYEVYLDIRLSSQAKASRPTQSVFLFTGGSFGPDYNDKYDPIIVPIPSEAVKVELASVISGHGGVDPGNCAEFCNTTHHFLVNGHEYMRSFPEAGTSRDCMDKVDEGTVPNQYGTWWYGRSGWCPGKEVPMVRMDVTDHVLIGDDNTFEYYGLYKGDPYPSGGAAIQLKSWVVIYM